MSTPVILTNTRITITMAMITGITMIMATAAIGMVDKPRRRTSTRAHGVRPVRKTTSPIVADADALDAHALYRLMAWLSPSYPVGAFSYSSGIEWAVEAGDIHDAETLRQWVDVV